MPTVCRSCHRADETRECGEREAAVSKEWLLSVSWPIRAGRTRGRAPGADEAGTGWLYRIRAQSRARRDAAVSRTGNDGPGTGGCMDLHQNVPGAPAREEHSAAELSI
jgi:hypothetical protein